MALHNSKLCQNGINILWGLSLLPHLVFVQLLSSLERNRRGRTYYGKNAEVEDTPPFDDVGNVDFSMARSGMVYGTARPDEPTGCTCECCNRRNDRGIRGMDGT